MPSKARRQARARAQRHARRAGKGLAPHLHLQLWGILKPTIVLVESQQQVSLNDMLYVQAGCIHAIQPGSSCD